MPKRKLANPQLKCFVVIGTHSHVFPISPSKIATDARIFPPFPCLPSKVPSLSDALLATFAKIKTLESLKLLEGRFTLDALRTLKSLPKLKQLGIAESDIAAADVEKLHADLPGVKIDFQPLTDEQRKKLESYLK